MIVSPANLNKSLQLSDIEINELRGLLMFGQATASDVASRIGISETELWRLVTYRQCDRYVAPSSN